jgi:hypothetical protein
MTGPEGGVPSRDGRNQQPEELSDQMVELFTLQEAVRGSRRPKTRPTPFDEQYIGAPQLKKARKR